MSASLKEGLLKAGSIEPSLLSRFENIRTTQERVTQVKAAAESLFIANRTALASNTATSIASSAKSQASSSVAAVNDAALATQINSSSSIETLAAVSSESSSEAASQIISNAVFEEEEEEDFSYTAADLLTRQLYVSKLTRWTSSYISYPKTSLRRGEEGSIRVTVTINRKGDVLDAQITDESQHTQLNKEAIKAIKKAAPYPALPDVIAGETFVFTMPIVFALQQ
jgi:TonB family protein